MAKRMLIDASHAEETRVVVADGTRLEEFDFESAARKQLKGNVYLAKVMRVEPSLQAAFVDYGGNRHGFLPFNEIHPDYYQIPVGDREALYAEQAAVGVDEPAAAPAGDKVETEAAADTAAESENDTTPEDDSAPPANPAETVEITEIAETAETVEAAVDESGAPNDSAPDEDAPDTGQEAAAAEGNGSETGNEDAESDIEVMGGDEMDDMERRRLQASRSLLSRRYRIQEVIKKRQILLVQVVKEERGNKGAALTTYLSLAGRYIVLMPNAIRGGGISRKIVNADDRRRLKKITNDLDIPARMAIIVRTAGLSRSKTEIRRDLEYLLRRWQSIRDLTMESMAPCVINEEANLIRRSIRDLYTRDIEQILVEGDEGYKTAKSFMKAMIPSHSTKVKAYRDRIPLFVRYQIESQLDAMYGPELQLKSGGYLVINPTEALVAIDVNSGRATRERSVEETALKTNLEAADEIARQLRLRDLAGLIVIDFIDMDESRNQRAVQRRLKEAMRNDRARIRIGRISPFGLMELSRQRLRPSLMEASMERCTGCGGTGVRRSVESSAVHALRAIEEEGLQGKSAEISVRVPATVGLYILNRKRRMLAEIEQRYNFAVSFEQDDSLVPPSYTIERVAARSAPAQESAEREADAAVQAAGKAAAEPEKRRRRRKPRTDGAAAAADSAAAKTAAALESTTDAEAEAVDGKPDEPPRVKRRRRGRRGGRTRTVRPQQEEPRESGAAAEAAAAPLAAGDDAPPVPATALPAAPAASADGAVASAAAEDDAPPAPVSELPAAPAAPADDAAAAGDDAAPAPAMALPAAPATPTDDAVVSAAAEDDAPPAPVSEPPAMPAPPAGDGARATVAAVDSPSLGAPPAADAEPPPAALDPADVPPDRPRRRGWWQRINRSSR